jgi:hypothetical protein
MNGELNVAKPPEKSGRSEIDDFLAKVSAVPASRPGSERGRLIFAMDATMSREPAWDNACQIQSEMFRETAELGVPGRPDSDRKNTVSRQARDRQAQG